MSNLGNIKWEQNGRNIRLVSILFLIKKECEHKIRIKKIRNKKNKNKNKNKNIKKLTNRHVLNYVNSYSLERLKIYSPADRRPLSFFHLLITIQLQWNCCIYNLRHRNYIYICGTQFIAKFRIDNQLLSRDC